MLNSAMIKDVRTLKASPGYALKTIYSGLLEQYMNMFDIMDSTTDPRVVVQRHHQAHEGAGGRPEHTTRQVGYRTI